VTTARWLALAALLVAVVFAIEGGSYNERNYLAVRQAERDSAQRVVVLQRAVDSLTAFRDSLANDPAVQERVAREQLGMVKPGELMFMIVRDSTPP
jgi:cell division protein FtsB